jgi:hypothetical protein
VSFIHFAMLIIGMKLLGGARRQLGTGVAFPIVLEEQLNLITHYIEMRRERSLAEKFQGYMYFLCVIVIMRSHTPRKIGSKTKRLHLSLEAQIRTLSISSCLEDSPLQSYRVIVPPDGLRGYLLVLPHFLKKWGKIKE